MNMSDCPKYNKCSAPICPLDPDWKKRSMAKDERVCFYLREAVKEGAQQRFSGGIAEEIYRQAVSLLPQMVIHVNYLQKRLQKAQETGSKMGHFPEQRRAAEVPATDQLADAVLWQYQPQGSAFTGQGATL